jgi:UDP-N-acetyl-D-glucosamine dehydrogenase
MMINDDMPEYCVGRAIKILNRFKKSLNSSKILVLGIAYKQDIDDYRESPALNIIKQLGKLGADVKYYDPLIPEYVENGVLRKGESKLTAKCLKSVDLVMITTAHTNIDYRFVQENSTFIFDTKNVMKEIKNRDNIEVL